MKKSRFSLSRIWQNNNILFVVAVLISIAVWIYMSMGASNDTSVTVSNIPVQIELSDEAKDNGLQIFSGADRTASVTISGNRAILGSVTASDITVTAAANAIDSSGEYQLSVTAAKTNPASNFTIDSVVTPSVVDVVVDYLRETSFDIQENVVYKVAEGYYASTSLSSKSVLITGPQTEISKISKVSAVAEIDGTLNSSSSTECQLVVYDSDNNVMSTELLSMELTSVKATVSVLPEKTVEVVPEFVNKPDGLEITDDMISIEPSSILLAGPQEILDSTDSVTLESIDFSTLKNEKKTFPKLGINIPADCKNISNSTTAEVTLDLSKLESKTFTVNKFSVDGLSSDYTADVTQNSISVMIIGPKDELSGLSASKITAVIDTADSQGTTGSVQMPVSFTISGTKSCWAYGSYKANLTISEKKT